MTNIIPDNQPAKRIYRTAAPLCSRDAQPNRIGYVLKRYPRYSETFVVNEILAHERAGLSIDIFALRPPNDTHFQDAISRVRASVTYLPCSGVRAAEWWQVIDEANRLLPGLFASLDAASGADAIEVLQAVVLARECHLRGLRHLHAHFATSATTVARLAARFTGLSYSFTAHAKDIFHQDVSRDDLQRKLTDALSVVTVSDFNLRFLQENYGDAAARVERIYNGLDLEKFLFRAPIARRPQIVAVGRLVEKKGFVDLIQACGLLRHRGLEFSCTIVGTGPLEAELREQIVGLELEDVVKLMGPQPQGQVIDLVQQACAFAAPCVIGEDGDRDGLPTVLLESMALGTPCVSTDVTGIPEVIHHGETGLLVPQHDPASLAEALSALITSSELSARLATSARRLIESKFHLESNAAGLRRLFAARRRAQIFEEVA
jgi:colanic acid/amylovoran biosynthesis glycosyltransferase